jgi:lysophospholipase L1-like esterase
VNDVDDLVGPDGVHPSVAGQQDLREKMEALIKDALPQPSTTPIG